jgi:hypothetical protein
MDGPEIESQCGARFSARSVPAVGPAQPPVHWVPFCFQGVKRRTHGVDHPPSSSDKVKERVELFFSSLAGPSWSVQRRTLPLLISEFERVQWSRGSVLDFGTQVRGFAHDRSRRIFRAKYPQHAFLRRVTKTAESHVVALGHIKDS